MVKRSRSIGMNETFEGWAKDIDENGALILKTKEKEIKVYSGDVSFKIATYLTFLTIDRFHS